MTDMGLVKREDIRCLFVTPMRTVMGTLYVGRLAGGLGDEQFHSD